MPKTSPIPCEVAIVGFAIRNAFDAMLSERLIAKSRNWEWFVLERVLKLPNAELSLYAMPVSSECKVSLYAMVVLESLLSY